MALTVSVGARATAVVSAVRASVKAGGGGQNMQDRKNDFFARSGGDEKEYLSKGMHQPRSWRLLPSSCCFC